MQHPHSPIPLKLSVPGEAVPIRTGAYPAFGIPQRRIAWRESPEDLDLRRSNALLGENVNHVRPERAGWVGPIINFFSLDRVRQAQLRVDVRQMQGAVVEAV